MPLRKENVEVMVLEKICNDNLWNVFRVSPTALGGIIVEDEDLTRFDKTIFMLNRFSLFKQRNTLEKNFFAGVQSPHVQ